MASGANRIVPRSEHRFPGGPTIHERRLRDGTPEFFMQSSHVVNSWTLPDGRTVFFDRATLSDPTLAGCEAAARGEEAASYERRGMQYEAIKCRSATSGSSC